MSKIKGKWDSIPITVKVSIAYAFCSIIQRCISFITLPLFTRVLTTEQYGQYTIYASWSGILTIFLTLNLAYGSFHTAMMKYEKDRDGYISAVEAICLALSLAFLIIYLPFQVLWNKLFELPTIFICIMVAEILGTTAIQLWSGKKRFEFKYKSVVAVTLGMAVVSPILALILVQNITEKGLARILGYAIIAILVGWTVYIMNALRGRKLLNKEYWRYALRFNIPLLAYYLSQVVFNQSDRIMISHLVGTDKAAVYGVAYSLATVLIFVLNAINSSYVPWYYGKLKEDRIGENKPIATGIALLMAILLSGVIWFAPEIIKIMAGAEYMEAIYVIPPVAVSILLLTYSQYFINVEFYYEEKASLVWASIGAAIANIILNWIFIRLIGFVAAAYTTLFSYILFAIANYYAMKKLLQKKRLKDVAYDYRWLLIIFFVFCILSAAGTLLYNILVARIIVACAVLVVVILKRKAIFSFYKTIKGK